MPSTLTELRDALRTALNDSVGPYLFPDEAVNQAIWEACSEHSFLFPWAATVRYGIGIGVIKVGLHDPAYLLDPAPGLVLSIRRVEQPTGTVIVQDPDPITDPGADQGSTTAQAWRWHGDMFYLRNPSAAAGLRVDMLGTWQVPTVDDVTPWNGPVEDRPLLLLLAQRQAFSLLAIWQAVAQGLTVPTIVGTSTNVRINTVPILLELDQQIDRAIKARRARMVRSRALDI